MSDKEIIKRHDLALVLKKSATAIATAIGTDLQASNNQFNTRVKLPTDKELVKLKIYVLFIGRLCGVHRFR